MNERMNDLQLHIMSERRLCSRDGEPIMIMEEWDMHVEKGKKER